IALGALSTLGSSLLLPGPVLAQGQQTCNGFLNISYPQFPTSPPCTAPAGIKCTQVGATCQCFIDGSSPPAAIDMRISVGAGDITGGTNLEIFNFVTALDCRRFLPLPNLDTVCGPNPDGPRVTFTDAVTTTCPSVLGGNIPWLVTPTPPPAGFPPPSELFTAPLVPPTPPFTSALQIPANTNPSCTTDLTFTVNTPIPTDAACTTGAAPLNCCTGAGTGFCQKSDNAACTDVLTPFPCCTGDQEGFCGFSNSERTGFHTPVACCFAANQRLCEVIQDGNDAGCTSGPAPLSCCTGAGTGFCECKDNAACTGFLTPFPCCRIGTGVGNCGDIFQLSEYVLAQCDNH